MRSVYKHSWKTLTAGSLFCFSFIPERVTTADNNHDLGWNRGVIRFPLFMLPEDSLVLSFCGKPIFDAHFLTCKCIKLDLNWSGRTIIDACKRRKVHFGVSALPWWNCETARRAWKKQQTVFNTSIYRNSKIESKIFPTHRLNSTPTEYISSSYICPLCSRWEGGRNKQWKTALRHN